MMPPTPNETGPWMAHLTDLVVISGFSGAGKSSAMNVFEDAGYFCVDNLPPEMIRSLAALFLHEGSKVERACVVSDLRAGDYFEEIVAVLDELDGDRGFTRVLFLEADEDTLLSRYKETRRRHPQARNGNVADGIHREQALLEPIRDRADTVLDTTGPERRRAAPQGRVGDARAERARPPGGHVRLVRPQARPGARRRRRARRPLPAQPALGARAARR